MPQIHPNGKHRIVLHSDVFSAQYVGDISLAECKKIAEILGQHRASLAHQPQYTVTDLAQLGSVSGEGKRVLIDWFKENPVEVLLFHGAGLAARAMVRMVRSASRVLYGKDLPMIFVADAAAAQQWIDNHRTTHRAG